MELEGGGYGVGEARWNRLEWSRDRTRRNRNAGPMTNPEETDEGDDDDEETDEGDDDDEEKDKSDDDGDDKEKNDGRSTKATTKKTKEQRGGRRRQRRENTNFRRSYKPNTTKLKLTENSSDQFPFNMML